jgi:hypothetical protein
MTPISRKRRFEETPPSPLLELPNDLFALIFSYLKKREIGSVYLSCKRFQRIIDQWPKDYIKPYIANCSLKTSKDIAFVNKFAPRLDTIVLKKFKSSQLSQIANLADKVTHIRFEASHIGLPAILLNTFTIFTNLVSLDLREAFTAIGTNQISLPESLKKLRATGPQISYLILPKSLKRLKVLEMPAARHYPNFKDLESLQIFTIGAFADIFSLSPCPLTEFKGVHYYRSPSWNFTVPYLISLKRGEKPIFQLGECTYEGPLADYFPCGEGLLKHKGKVVFQGVFKEGFIESGQGSLVLDLAAISNFWTDTVTVHYHNGSTFTGNSNGQGISTDPFGRSFKGIFQDRMPFTGSGFVSYGENRMPFTGSGLVSYGEEWYEGHLVEGKFKGFGRYFHGGTLLEGHWTPSLGGYHFKPIIPYIK